MNFDNLFVMSQYLAPQHLISRFAGKVAECSFPPFKNKLISWFIDRYEVDMSEAAQEDPTVYKHFNDFFTRALKDGARQIDTTESSIISPVDGAVSQLGEIRQGRIFQAKGQSYSAEELLGGDHKLAEQFAGGQFATIYLAPKDYHRIHMPQKGTLKQMVYVPGDLFSVNPVTAENVPRLFARNERVVAIFESENGPFAMVLVGAMIVASIETSWAGLVAPHARRIQTIGYGSGQADIQLDKGDEMGRFKLGSTVVLLFPKGSMQFEPEFEAESVLRMGQKLARKL